jgi:broad specificity phosphatase PhoE
MITLIRHSERLDSVNYKKWKRSKRYKENPNDTPITSNGKKIAKKSYNKLFDSGYQKVDYLYCSPLTRCIETCLVIKKEIKKKLKKDIKIRIENGLIEWSYPGGNTHIFFKNEKFNYNTKIKYLDEKLSLENIIKKFGDHFDPNYKSILKFNQVKFDIYEAEFMNRCIKVFEDIRKQIKKNDNVIICTHSGVIFGVYSYLIKNYNVENENQFRGENYCSILITNHQKTKKKVINKFD